MSSLGAVTVHSLELAIPAAGVWRADVVLETGEAPALGSATLTVGDLVLSGTVQRAGLDAPDLPHAVVVGGTGGWDALVARPLSFQSDAGVRLSTVLSALSAAAGEPIEQPTDATLGDHYECVAARPGEPVRYRDALNELVRSGALAGWRVDPDGVTRFGARAGSASVTRATVLRRNGALGSTTYGIDSPADFLPGNLVEGATIGRVVIREQATKLEAEIWPTTSAPPVRTLVQQMVAALLGDVVRTYVVASVRGDKRLDLVPPPDAPHLPELAAVEQWSLGGALVTPTAGAEVMVAFRDYPRRTRPVAFAFGPGKPDETEHDADIIKLGAAASAGAARLGDDVKSGALTLVPVDPANPLGASQLVYVAQGSVVAQPIAIFPTPGMAISPVTPPLPAAISGAILTASSKVVVE